MAAETPILPPAVEDMAQAPSSLIAMTKTPPLEDLMVDRRRLHTEAEITRTVMGLAILVAARETQAWALTVKTQLIPLMETPQLARAVMEDLEDEVETLIAMGRMIAPVVDMVANRVVVGVTITRFMDDGYRFDILFR